MQLKSSDFYIISSGKTHSVEEFAKKTFRKLGMDYKKYLKVDEKLIRKSKTGTLTGDFLKL